MITPTGPSATVEVPCTCGELVQGYLDGEPFLVSCPIAIYSRVAVALDAPQTPDAPPKAAQAAAATLRALGHPARPFSLTTSPSLSPSLPLSLHPSPFTPHPSHPLSPISHPPVLHPSPFTLHPSRGYGTSTADVVGAIAAAALAVGTALDAAQISRLAVSVEPSDSTMFPGLAAFNHRSAATAHPLGAAPPLAIAVLEFEGAVDTLEYNSHLDLAYLRATEPVYREALGLLRRGLSEGRWDLVGRAATMSARANQRLLPKPALESAISLAEAHGALGVCAAHSGTLLGVLFRPEHAARAQALAAQAPGRLPNLERAFTTHLVDGGPRRAREKLEV